MSELRWILLGLGAAFCVGLWWWETHRRRQAVDSLKDHAPRETETVYSPPSSRMEPSLGEAVTVEEKLHGIDPLPVHTQEQTFIEASPDAGTQSKAADVGSGTAIDMAPDEIVSLRVLASPQQPFEGRALVKALLAAGIEHGKFSIFHKYDVDGRTLFSVASLVEPGSFDLQHIDGRLFRGVTFFTMTKASGEAGLLAMKLAAQDLAKRLQGMVQEETRNR